LGGVDAVALRQADVVEFLLVEERLQFAQTARKLRLVLRDDGLAEGGVFGARREGLQCREARIEREELLVVAGRAKIAVELGAGVEERLVVERALHQGGRTGRDARRPHRRDRRIGILRRGFGIDANASFGSRPRRQQIGADAAGCAARPAQKGGGNVHIGETDQGDSERLMSLKSRKRAVGA
jgi:hypothetical protein